MINARKPIASNTTLVVSLTWNKEVFFIRLRVLCVKKLYVHDHCTIGLQRDVILSGGPSIRYVVRSGGSKKYFVKITTYMLILGIVPGSENKINTRIWKVQAQNCEIPAGKSAPAGKNLSSLIIRQSTLGEPVRKQN
jgi:hypothetical protein